MCSEINSSFTSLRQTVDRIITIVSEVTSYEREKIDLKTSINNDIGVDGDDWDDLLIALKERGGLNLEGLNFYDYFQDEGQIADPSGYIHGFVSLVRYITSLSWLKISFTDYVNIRGTSEVVDPSKNLTIGDLVTSKFEGRFVKRSERKFVVI